MLILLLLLVLLHGASSFMRSNALSSTRLNIANNAVVGGTKTNSIPTVFRSLQLINLRGERIKLNNVMKEKSVVIFLRHLGLVIRIITLTC